MREFNLGKIANLRLIAEPSVIVGTIVLWSLLSAVGVWLLVFPPGQAVFGGLIATLMYWV